MADIEGELASELDSRFMNPLLDERYCARVFGTIALWLRFKLLVEFLFESV